MSLARNLQTISHEHGFQPCQTEGVIPSELTGTLYRNGSGIFERYGVAYKHWFGGHGVINAMRFDNGSVSCAVKTVKTDAFKKEEKKQKAIYSSYGNVIGKRWFNRLFSFPKNAANTSVLFWQNQLYALEEGNLATQIHPDTLETGAATNFNVEKMSRFSAHPTWVSDLACGFNFGVKFGRQPMLQIFKIPQSGDMRLMAEHALPFGCYLHDFTATNTHLVFFICPVKLNTNDFLLGKRPFASACEWTPELGTTIWAIPIDNPHQKVVLKTEACFIFHFANAYNNGNDIVVDYIKYDDFSVHDGFFDVQKNIDTDNVKGGKLIRTKLNLETGSVDSHTLSNNPSEFPIVPPAYQGKRAPHVLSAYLGSPSKRSYVMKYDYQTNQEEVFEFDQGVYGSEPIMVPYEKGTAEGYLLDLVYDSNAHQSYIAILKTDALSSGIIGKAFFNQNIPLGFHGRWVQGIV